MRYCVRVRSDVSALEAGAFELRHSCSSVVNCFVQAAAGGIALVACFAVPIIAILRLLGHDFHFELH